MKKYLLWFLILTISGFMYLFYKSIKFAGEKSGDPNFVSIEGKKFKINGNNFFPLALNYIVALNIDEKGLWVSPSHDYLIEGQQNYSHDNAGLDFLRGDMNLIKEMGFNTVRIVGVGEIGVLDGGRGELYITARNSEDKNETVSLNDANNKEQYFKALEELFQIIDEAGLKIIFLNKMLPEVSATENHFAELATRFKSDSTILAYDLYNEPLYFDKPERTKQEVYEITTRWMRIIRKFAPDHLITIGLQGIRESMEWDPNMINVDFISFHPYEFELNQVVNEMYWYGRFVDKPWIIGETAIPADNDSITYDAQKTFAEKTLIQTLNCNGSGYSWWQYKDVIWFRYHSNFMGVVSREGVTTTSKDSFIVHGTVKPVAEAFGNFDPDMKRGECELKSNYYNYSGHQYFKLTGRLLEKNNSPVKDGVIAAWNEDWSHLYHTVTKDDGTFELYSDYDFFHWKVTALKGYREWGDIDSSMIKTDPQGIRYVDIGDIFIRRIVL